MSNEKNNRKKSSKEKRVLIASVIVAGTIVAGSTFAWFTSSDTVTNKLSASGEYGVAIAESFEPTANWVPGQSIKKEAHAVNTGNVDAFVRMWFTGNLRVVTENENGELLSSLITKIGENKIVDGDIGGNFSKMQSGTGTYYRVLNDSDDADERKIMQTPYIVYAGGSYHYTDAKTKEKVDGTQFTNGGEVRPVDSGSFEPDASGLYIFRRVLDGNDVEYSGYYCYVNGNNKTYYALVDSTQTGTNDNDNTTYQDRCVYISGLSGTSGEGLVDAIKNLKVRTATRSVLSNDQLTWKYVEPANASDSPFGRKVPYIVVSIAQPDADTTQNSIKFNIELDNISDGTETNTWQHIATGSGESATKHTFYYTNDVQSGGKTLDLIKAVQLDTGLKEGASVSFDFDLNINLESIQLFKGDDGKESTENVVPDAGWTSNDTNITVATVAKSGGNRVVTYANDDSREIDTIKWANVTNTNNGG